MSPFWVGAAHLVYRTYSLKNVYLYFMSPPSKKSRGDTGLGCSFVCLSVNYPCTRQITVRDRIMKFGTCMWNEY